MQVMMMTDSPGPSSLRRPTSLQRDNSNSAENFMTPAESPRGDSEDAVTITNQATDTGLPEQRNKPKGTRLRQQKLPAWQPILTADTVIPAFVLVGVIFLPIGIILFRLSNDLFEEDYDYTTCKQVENGRETGRLCKDVAPEKQCQCTFSFNIPNDIEGDVYFYYGLGNFYQNHRRYVNSRSDNQYQGNLENTGDCEPYEEIGNDKIAPCGAVANSKFNDTYTLINDKDGTHVPLTYKGVAWPVDKKEKFKNPEGDLETAFKGYAKPPSWGEPVWKLDPKHPENNGFLNTDFIVWMRTAALPNFRKLWRKLDRTEETRYKNGLPNGNYTVLIEYRFNVDRFDGTKRVVISSTSAMGGKNAFLGIAYMFVGSLCLALAVVFGIIHCKYGGGVNQQLSVNP